MNKTLMMALAALTLFSANSYANPFFSKIVPYVNIKTGEVIELSDFDIDQGNGSATYFSYKEGRKIKIALNEISKQTKSEIAGVKAGEMILIQTTNSLKPCAVWNVFENGMARIGCQSGKIIERIGVDRPQILSYTLLAIDQPGVIAEVESLNGVNKFDRGSLTVDAGVLKAGTKIRVEAIFANGEAMVQKMGINFLDTSGLLMKYNVEKINLSDLKLD